MKTLSALVVGMALTVFVTSAPTLTPAQTKVIDWSYYRGTVPGYGAARWAPGEYAALLPDRYVESSFSGFTGQAPLPGENINYLRIPHLKGDGRMAGGGQITNLVLEWDVTHWAPRGTMWGPNALVYGYGDFLTLIGGVGEYQRTGGYRFGYGALTTAISTYADVTRDLYEYTDYGDVAIGQTASGRAGVSFRKPGGGFEPMRYLDPVFMPGGFKDCRFVLVDREGEFFGIAVPELIGRKTYMVWATKGELRGL